MKLFDVIPEGLFQLLTGSYKQVYAECLLLLYEYTQTERFGIRYEVMRDLIQELLESRVEYGDALDGLEGEEEGADSRQDQVSMEEVTRAKAGFILRRLERLRWVDVETRNQFERFLVLPHYASRIIGVLRELCEARTVEYQRFAFLIFQSLTGEAAKQQPCSAVLSAADVSRQFRQELIALYNNMKHHMEQVVQQSTIQEVLDHHFDQYKSQIIDKSYHRLKTSDHVARYRLQILHTVQQWLLDPEILRDAANDGVKSGIYPSAEEAERAVKEALFFIEDTFAGLEDIFYQIDVRHNQYLRSSFERARYLSQQNEGLETQLARMLELMGKHKQGPVLDGDRLFALRQVRMLSEPSLLPPRRKRAPHQPEAHVVVDMPAHVREELRGKNAEKIRKAVTRKKVDDYVLGKLGGRPEMEMQELAPRTVEEFILLGYVYLYGSDGGSGFKIKRNPERQVMLVGGYRFDNHIVQRKEGGRRR